MAAPKTINHTDPTRCRDVFVKSLIAGLIAGALIMFAMSASGSARDTMSDRVVSESRVQTLVEVKDPIQDHEAQSEQVSNFEYSS